MSAFLDASVIVAILAREPDDAEQSMRLQEAAGPIFVSSLVVFEATIGLARNKAGPNVRLTSGGIEAAKTAVMDFITAIDAQEAPLPLDAGFGAVDAISRYGKHVGHPAKLNMGDAFAYICAKAAKAPLIYKGADFTKTDIPTA